MSLKIHSNAVILRYKSPISMILKRQWFQVFLGKVCRSSYHILIIKYIIKQCTAYFLHNVSSKYHFIYVSDIYSRCCYWYITCFNQIQTYLCKKSPNLNSPSSIYTDPLYFVVKPCHSHFLYWTDKLYYVLSN